MPPRKGHPASFVFNLISFFFSICLAPWFHKINSIILFYKKHHLYFMGKVGENVHFCETIDEVSVCLIRGQWFLLCFISAMITQWCLTCCMQLGSFFKILAVFFLSSSKRVDEKELFPLSSTPLPQKSNRLCHIVFLSHKLKCYINYQIQSENNKNTANLTTTFK